MQAGRRIDCFDSVMLVLNSMCKPFKYINYEVLKHLLLHIDRSEIPEIPFARLTIINEIKKHAMRAHMRLKIPFGRTEGSTADSSF